MFLSQPIPASPHPAVSGIILSPAKMNTNKIIA
jgi:hypothetical protein